MHIRLVYLDTAKPDSWGDGAPLAAVEQVMQDGIDQGICEGLYVDAWWFEWSPELELVQATGAANGSLIFVDVDTSMALMFLEANQITAGKIASSIEAICALTYDEGDGGWYNPDGTPWGFGDGQGQAGCLVARIPLIGPYLDFLCGVEKWLWLALGILGTVKAMESGTQAGKVGWGALGAFGGYKSAQAFKLQP